MNPAKKILLVDDELSLLNSLTVVLQKHGYLVAGASNAQDAYRLLRTTDYDLIMLDLFMPGIDGLQQLNQVHKLYPETPIFIFTGSSSSATADEARRLGAVEFLMKPLDPLLLLEKIDSILSR